MAWLLAPHAHLAAPNGDLVFLDARSGSYACLAGAAARLRFDADGGLDSDEPALLSELRLAGLVVPVSESSNGALPPPPPVMACLSGDPARPDRDQVRRMIAAGLFMLRHYRGRSFSHLLATARRGACWGGPPQAISPAIEADVAAFRHMLPWVPFQGACLFRSFMLLNLLRRGGADARWVFGVRTWPFSAHCWLQIGAVVLDDDLDHAAGYSPILAV